MRISFNASDFLFAQLFVFIQIVGKKNFRARSHSRYCLLLSHRFRFFFSNPKCLYSILGERGGETNDDNALNGIGNM